MATLSPNAASWYKPSMGGSRPASNQTGFGSGMAGASARRFLRSGAGGAEAVRQQYNAFDRQNQYDRQDQLRRRELQIEANKKAADMRTFEEWKKQGGISDGQQQRTPTMGRVTGESTNYMGAPAGTRTNPATGAMSAPSLTPSISIPAARTTAVPPNAVQAQGGDQTGYLAQSAPTNSTITPFSFSGQGAPDSKLITGGAGTGSATPLFGPKAEATFDGMPASQFFQGSANSQGQMNAFAKPAAFATSASQTPTAAAVAPLGDIMEKLKAIPKMKSSSGNFFAKR